MVRPQNQNEVPLPSARVTSGRYTSTFFPPFDVDALHHQPLGECPFSQHGNRTLFTLNLGINKAGLHWSTKGWLVSGADGGSQVRRDTPAALACSFQRSEFTPITISQSWRGISARPASTAMTGKRKVATGGNIKSIHPTPSSIKSTPRMRGMKVDRKMR